jgi:hypothetical protein
MSECRKAKSADGLNELLLDRRCRDALHCLQVHEDPLTLADLAEEVAVRETGMALTEISATDVKEIYMSLYYTQIPRLEGEDLVRYDQETDTVARHVGREHLVEIVETARKPKC